MSKHRNLRNVRALKKSGILGSLSIEEAILRRTRAFKQVAAVIGGEDAMRELLRVVRECDARLLRPASSDCHLSTCFLWRDTPQGHAFWRDIDCSPKCPL